MTAPLVSVIIPAFNRAHSVSASIDSVLRQSHRHLEVIVVDDGSTDKTAEVLASYGERILSIRQGNGGPSSARNTGVAHAKGEIIAFLDSDDTWKQTKLERQVRLMMDGKSRVPCCVCNASIVVNGVNVGSSFNTAGIDCDISEGYWLNPTDLIATRFLLFNQVVAIRRDVFDKVGGFKEHLRLLEDHDLAFRLSLLGPWAFISDTLVTKYDQDDGLGVQARRDPILHINAWMTANRNFLNEPIKAGGDIERYILRNLDEGAIEIRATTIMNSSGSIAQAIGKMIVFGLRIRRAIRRRLPSWPRASAIATLP